MARVRIRLPEHFPFTTELDVYIEHINAGYHLDHARLLALVAEARSRLFAHLGGNERDLGDGVGMIVADLAVRYRSEAFHGDRLTCALGIAEPHPLGFDLLWKLTHAESGREIARGKHGMVAFDYTTRRPVPLPAAFWHRWQLAFGNVSLLSHQTS